MKKVLFTLLLIAAMFIAVSAGPVQAGEQKVTICHIPPGNTGNPQNITISPAAWPAHQAHGDSSHPCEV
jgi:hypothetical protein